MADNWHERFDDKPSDVERWADMRARSAVRNRRWFLIGSGIFLVVSGPFLFEACMVLARPGWRSLLGIDVESAPLLAWVTGVQVGISALVQVLIRRYWKAGAT